MLVLKISTDAVNMKFTDQIETTWNWKYYWVCTLIFRQLQNTDQYKNEKRQFRIP